jgi:hypothetical protein
MKAPIQSKRQEESHIRWRRIYIFILGYNAFLIIIFYLLRLSFNSI